jgi:hypothetical protein
MVSSHSRLEDYSMTNNAYIRQLDPIQGLVDYVLDVKPYHTKIIEVMIEYVYNDNATGVVSDTVNFSWGPTRFPIAIASPALDQFILDGDFTDAMLYIMGSPSETLTIIDTGGNQTSHEIVGAPVFGAGVTTVTVSPNLPAGASYALLEGDIIRYFSFDVTEFDEENQTITVSGPATADIFNGQRIRVMPSANVYTVQGSPTFNGLTTIIPVAETLSGETLGSPAATIEPEQYYIP